MNATTQMKIAPHDIRTGDHVHAGLGHCIPEWLPVTATGGGTVTVHHPCTGQPATLPHRDTWIVEREDTPRGR